MKYYGLRHKIRSENLTYFYAKTRAKALSILPGRRRDFWKRNYELIFEDHCPGLRNDNSIPEGSFLRLDQICTADLAFREDIKKLQKGIRHLLLERRSSRFLGLPVEGLDEICKRIGQMDSTLLSWYDAVDCGVFDFSGLPLESSIDHFTMRIKNMNSAYLELEFTIHLSEQKKQELIKIISSNYHEGRGYAHSTLTAKSNSSGSFENYTVVNYNDDALKADKIYEFISYIEWEFFEQLRPYFQLLLHERNVMPPRMEVYYTDIDYHDDNRSFWHSIGVADYQGQFIDDQQKVFFDCSLSGRYEHHPTDNRLIYIIKDDGIEAGHLESVKDDVYFHMKEYSQEYFRFLFLDTLSKEIGKLAVSYKHRLDRIKLHKNRLKELLKLKYQFSRDIDYYNRYIRDGNWERSKKELEEIYKNNEELVKKISRPFYTSYEHFCNRAISGAEQLEKDINVLLSEFDSKGNILQNLSNYKNAAWNIRINVVMLIVASTTLFFVVFPEKASVLSDFIRSVYHSIIDLFK